MEFKNQSQSPLERKISRIKSYAMRKIFLVNLIVFAFSFEWGCNKPIESAKEWHKREIATLDNSKFGVAVDKGEMIIICEKKSCGRYDSNYCFTHTIEKYYNTTDNVGSIDSADYLVILNNKEKIVTRTSSLEHLPLPENFDNLKWRKYDMFDEEIEYYILHHLDKDLDAFQE